MALRSLRDMAMRGGGKLDERARWALEWRLRLLLTMAPRMIKPLGRIVDVRIYSDDCAICGRVAASALASRRTEDFTVVLKGAAEQMLLECL